MDALIFAISIVAPNLILMALGFYLKHKEHITQSFVDQGSNLVFNISLPALMFLSLTSTQVPLGAALSLVGAGVIVTFILFFASELYARYFILQTSDKGVFVQGVFRSNMAIVGLATCVNAYGDAGLGLGAMYMGFVTILFNVLAVITLSRTSEGSAGKYRQMLIKMLKNPLILSLVAAYIYKGLMLPIPSGIFHDTLRLLANIALPLALLCAGASIELKSMLGIKGASMQASIGRVVVAPVVAICVGRAMHLEPIQLGVLFFMVSAPSAAASYVMAKAMGGNWVLAANILAFTTIFSMLGIGFFSVFLRQMGWI